MCLSQRERQAELMDDPGLDADMHRRALTGLGRINRLSGTAGILWSAVSREINGESPLKILDLASGGGDLAISLARRAVAAGVGCTIQGWDVSPTAVSHAQSSAMTLGLGNVEFRVRNALSEAIAEPFDVVLSSLFLHHLANDEAGKLLRKMREATRGLVLVDDLRRTRLGYWAAWVGCRLLTRSPIVHVDGPRSVQAAFSEAEVRELACAAGLGGAILKRHWPQRFLLTWRKP